MTILNVSVKSVGRQFIKKEALLTPLERKMVSKLRSHGAYTRRSIQQRQRKGGPLPKSKLPDEIKALLGLGRDPKTGRFMPGADISDIAPWPKRTADPRTEDGPRYHSKLLRKHTYYIVDPKAMSVIIGPARLPGLRQKDVPELMENGGTGDAIDGEWIRIYEGGRPTKIRLARRVRKRVRYKGFEHAGTAHEEALDRNIPAMYEDLI